MHMLNRVLLVAIAAGLVMGSPATAQIKNPIQAAKDAFKKAKEEEEAKRAQQRPQQPPRPPAANVSTRIADGRRRRNR
jgi:hypothetical protein